MAKSSTDSHNKNLNKIDDVFEFADTLNFGELHFKHDKTTGLQAIVAIHSTKLGPALGGCRFIDYPSTDAAIIDAMRLARGMSYKASICNLPLGGGKSVIINSPEIKDRTQLLKSFGRFIEDLHGKYITAKDSGTTLDDMDIIASETSYIATTSTINGDNGNPSPYTAEGVIRAIMAAVKYRHNKDSVAGLTVAMQGVGDVGYLIAQQLHKMGASLVVCDTDELAVARCATEFNAKVVETDAIYAVDCDIFSPCALGATLNEQTIGQIKASIIAGCANNQLKEDSDGMTLMERGILYAPDYLANAGGLIHAHCKYLQLPDKDANEKIHNIYDASLNIFKQADKKHYPTNQVADMIAAEKL